MDHGLLMLSRNSVITTFGIQQQQPSSNHSLTNNINMILNHTIIEECCDKLVINTHVRSSLSSTSNNDAQIMIENFHQTIANNKNNLHSKNTLICSPIQQKKQKNAQLNSIHKLIMELKENGNILEDKLTVVSPTQKLKNNHSTHFLSVIRALKNETQKHLETALQESKIQNTCNSLQSEIKHEKDIIQRRDEMQKMVKNITANISNMKNNSAQEKIEFDKHMISMKSNNILLKEDISKLKQNIEVNQKLRKYELFAQLNTDKREHKIYENLLQLKFDSISEELKREQQTFQATQKYLLSKLSKCENDLQCKQKKYNAIIADEKEKLNAVKNERDATLFELQKCEKQLADEKSMYNLRIEKEKKKEELQKKIDRSAIILQRATRKFLLRKRLEKEKQKKKKKKKSKKDKKDKKSGGKKASKKRK